jgi:hypothetical protein
MDDSKSPLREMMAEAGVPSYHPLNPLTAAQADPHGIAVLEVDDSGQIYIVCPAHLIKCSENVLSQLLSDIDVTEWPGNDPTVRRIFFESRLPGQGIPGGMGGAKVDDDIWIHPRLVKSRLADPIKAVLTGKKGKLR